MEGWRDGGILEIRMVRQEVGGEEMGWWMVKI